MVVAYESDRLGVTDLGDRLDARTRLGDTETVAGEDLLVTLRVELREAGGELKLLSVDRERAVGAFLTLHGVRRQALRVNREEITHARLLQLQITRHAVERHDVNDVFLHRSEDPLEHVVEMHADVGCYAAGLVHIAFPRRVVPVAAARYVGQIDIVDFVLRTLVHFLLERTDLIVQTELEDGVSLVSGLFLQLHEVVDVIGVEHQRLLADHVAAQPQPVTDEGIVGVVRRTDREPVERVVGTHLFGAEAVELLIFRVERTIRERAVEPSHGVKLVVRYQQVVAGVGDRFNVPRRYVPCGAY